MGHFPEWVKMGSLISWEIGRDDQSGIRSLGVGHHTVALFHHHSIPSQDGLSPGSQLGDRFLRDLERRPVLLWTAHSAAAAVAVPGVSLAPPGGE